MNEKNIVAVVCIVIGLLVFFTTEIIQLGLLLILLAALVVKGSLSKNMKPNDLNNKSNTGDQ